MRRGAILREICLGGEWKSWERRRAATRRGFSINPSRDAKVKRVSRRCMKFEASRVAVDDEGDAMFCR
jgi:hypothetical protein